MTHRFGRNVLGLGFGCFLLAACGKAEESPDGGLDGAPAPAMDSGGPVDGSVAEAGPSADATLGTNDSAVDAGSPDQPDSSETGNDAQSAADSPADSGADVPDTSTDGASSPDGSPDAAGAADASPDAPAPDAALTGTCGIAGQLCCAHPGEIPDPECDDGDETTCAPTTCKVASSCGSTQTCEPMIDQTGKSVLDFRFRRLIFVSPASLANATVQNTAVSSGVDLNAPQCAEKGTGGFNWLMRLDTTKNQLTTGAAPPCDSTSVPSCDPYADGGFCFEHKNVGAFHAAPATVPMAKAANGTYQTTQAIPLLSIAEYFQGSIWIWPISEAWLAGIKVSAGGNCIGSVNTSALQADCSDNYQNCSKWLTDGALAGFITLENADAVDIKLLNESLCAVMTGKKDPATGKCPRDASGNMTVHGDFCSTTNSPGGCADSYWFSATFAAAAARIDDTGAGQPACTANP